MTTSDRYFVLQTSKMVSDPVVSVVRHFSKKFIYSLISNKLRNNYSELFSKIMSGTFLEGRCSRYEVSAHFHGKKNDSIFSVKSQR